MGTLGYAILGLLAKEPRTGYQIARAMNRPIGYIWTARHSQIYPELASLEADGLVRHAVVDGRGPRETKRYEITTTVPPYCEDGSTHRSRPTRPALS